MSQKTAHLAWCLQPPPAEREQRVCLFPGAAEGEPTNSKSQKMCRDEKDAAAMFFLISNDLFFSFCLF